MLPLSQTTKNTKEKENGDIILASDLNKVWSDVPFIRKHFKNLVLAHIINNKADQERMHRLNVRNSLLGYALVTSLFFNFVEAHYPKKPNLSISLSNESHDLIHITTMMSAINTKPIILEWTKRAVIESLTYSFSSFDEQLESVRKYYTKAGFLGFSRVMREEYKNNMVAQRLDMSVVFNGPAVISQPITATQPWLIVEVPILMSFYDGSDRALRSISYIASVKVVPVPSSESLDGKAIDSITLESAN